MHTQKFKTEAASFIFNQPETKSDAFIFGVDCFHLSSIKDESNAVELDMQASASICPLRLLGNL